MTATAVAAGTFGVLVPPASAAISGFGPIDPASNFPVYYTDGNGLSLAMCEDGGTLCLSGPEKIQDVHAIPGADAEAFYYVADAQTPTFVLHNALEAAYAGDGANQEVVFMRTQVTARDGGLVAGATYTVTDPYGTFTCVAETDDTGAGHISQNGCRIETEPVATEFHRALGGRIGPFLTRDPAAPAPPAGYLGAIDDYHKVVGSPTGFNAFRVTGPGLAGTCTDGGTVIQNCEQTDLFFTLGKIADTGVPSASVSHGALDFGDVPTTPAVTKTLTYANTGTQPVTINSIALGGTNASAFSQTNNCPVAPATLDGGMRCTFDVTFTPEAGKASTATLTITDNTVAATRDIALRGSNLPKMVVADPVPPAALAFGNQAINTTSGQLNVVIGNTGTGPLTVASADITGFSAQHFKKGANDTCTGVLVAPGSGCEIGVAFAPTTTGGKTASLVVTDANGVQVTVPLTGSGVESSNVAPTVRGRTPAINKMSVGLASNVTATFTEAVQGVSTGTFQVKSPTGAVVPAVVSRNGTTNQWILNPNANLTADTKYTVTLTGGATAIRDLQGAALVGTAAQPLTWSFTTGPAPRLIGRAPGINATGVNRGVNVTVNFSEAVQSVSGKTFFLRTATGTTNITATVTRDGTTNRYILNPSATLAANTQYRVRLDGGPAAIRDMAGNPLIDVTWTFTTGG